jgi:DNA adenine methylase
MGINTPALEQGANVLPYLQALAARLRHVRVCCGEWDRVLGPSATTSLGMCGILFDPPYSSDAVDQVKVYDELSDPSISGKVREWCVEHGEDANLRIALCGYEGEHNELDVKHGWSKVYWKAQGGYGCQRKDGTNENRRKERIWFNPACITNELPFDQPVDDGDSLFGDDEEPEEVETVEAEEDLF